LGKLNNMNDEFNKDELNNEQLLEKIKHTLENTDQAVMIIIDNGKSAEIISNGCTVCFYESLAHFIQENNLPHLDVQDNYETKH